MLSGRRAFRRDTTAETMTAVLKEDPPDFAQIPCQISPALDRIIRRCLEKRPDQRFQSARDLAFALSALSGSDSTSALKATAAEGQGALWAWIGIPLLVAALAAAAWLGMKRVPAVKRQQFAISVPGEVSHMALSADGSMLAFVSPEESTGLPMIYVQAVGSADATLLAGTEGASFPFWSPDNRFLAFFANGKLLKIEVSGGVPQALTNVLSARGGTWGSRDVIVYAPDAGSVLWRIRPDGTGAAPFTTTIREGDSTHRWPIFLPDGDHFLFWAGNFANARNDQSSGIYISSLAAKEKKLLVLCRSSVAYDARSLYYANDDRRLVSLPFDLATGKVTGSPMVVADVVGFQASTYWTALTASPNGTLVYNSNTGAATSELTWMDRNGKELGRVGEPAVQANPSISPDGTRVAVDISDPKLNNVDIWLESLQGAGNMRFTFNPGEEVVGVWSRDGKYVAYRENLDNGAGLFTKLASGLDRERKLAMVSSLEFDIIPNSWALGDTSILCLDNTPNGSTFLLVPATGGEPKPFLEAKGSETNGQISPDGKWLAYASDETGNWEIYVTKFPEAVGKWQVSRGGGNEPRWRGDGKEIFYIGPRSVLTSVAVAGGETFSTGNRTALFQFHQRAPVSSTDLFSYDVTRDGSRFLVNKYVKPERIPPLNIVLHTEAPTTP
jgi:Tol biopolymer transport system component